MRRRVLMLFVDGLGIAAAAPDNPVDANICPVLAEGLSSAHKLDACMGVPGLPQSATGQTALLTGINAAVFAGRHVEGFPGGTLTALLERENIMLRLKRAGYSVTFANAYYFQNVSDVHLLRRKSVTTVSMLSACGRVRLTADMLAGRAVYHDLTRESLRERGYTGALITPEEAAGHLLSIAADHEFTLFEYFLTDHAGHSRARGEAERVLINYERFLVKLLERSVKEKITVVLVSDHGNVEDLSIATHTMNPVPLAVWGSGRGSLGTGVTDLTGVAPSIIKWLK